MKKAILFQILCIGFCLVISGQEEPKKDTRVGVESRAKYSFSESKSYKPLKKNEKNIASNINTLNSLSGATRATEDDIIKIDSTLVTIPVSISEILNGRYVKDLTKNEFKIFEDGIEQEIAYFGAFDKPFTVILVLDTSPSTKYKIEEIQNAAKTFVDQLKPQDRVEVIKFNEKIRVLARATSKRQKIYKAIQKARFDGGTSLYDVVDFALTERLKKVRGRKAIVLFTDGVDTTSEDAFFEETVSKAEISDTVIFPIYYNTAADLLAERKKKKARFKNRLFKDYRFGKMYLDELATSTGGRVISPDSTPEGLNSAFKTIAEELSYQYSIGYYPKEEGIPGQRKKIKVRVYRPNLEIRARDNYVVNVQ